MISWWKGVGALPRLIMAAMVVFALIVGVWAIWRVIDAPRRAAEAKVEARTATAYGASARAAMDVVTAATARDEATKEKIDEALDQIRELPEAERYGATIGLLCGMREYASDERCTALQRPGPGRVEEGRAGHPAAKH